MINILSKLDLILRNFSRRQIKLMSLLIISIIATADIYAGHEVSVSIFFLLPIAITSWYGSHRAGIWLCVLSAMVWFLIDLDLRVYSYAFAPYWNATVRLGFFLIVEGLLNQLRIHLNTESSMARSDALTGLLNVRGFFEQAGQLFNLAARHNRSLVLAYIDLDNFKQVNDKLGHGEGDKVLKFVGEKITSSLRMTDVAGRMGGDEFAVVLPESDEAGARSVFDTLGTSLMLEAQKNHWPISFSIGVVSFNSPSCGLNEAIRIADALMYQVKVSGKNNIMFQHHAGK